MLESLSFFLLLCTALFFGFLYRMNQAARRDAAQRAGADAARPDPAHTDRDAA